MCTGESWRQSYICVHLWGVWDCSPFPGFWSGGCLGAHTASKSVGKCSRTSFSTVNQKTSALKPLRHDKPVLEAAWPAILTVVVPKGQRVSGKTERSPSTPQNRDSCLNVNEIRTESSKVGVWDWRGRQQGNELVGRVSALSKQITSSLGLCFPMGAARLVDWVFWPPRCWFRGRRKEVDRSIPRSRSLVGRLGKGLRVLYDY